IQASGGNPVAVTKLDRAVNHRAPYFLPDGRHFVFYVSAGGTEGGLYLGSLDSGEEKRLTAADSAGVYINSGWLSWVRAGALIAQRLDLNRQILTGDPVTLGEPVFFDSL